MRTGTSHFVSIQAAELYYSDYIPNFSKAVVAAHVANKIKSGDIHIGKPELKPGETLVICDDGTRYAIDDGKP